MQRGSGKGAADYRGRWLSAWSGAKVDVKRTSTESFFVARTALSVFGSVQPDTLRVMRAADLTAGADTAGSDGLWSRFLYSQPDGVPWQWNALEVSVADLVFNLYQQIDALVPEWDPDRPPHLLQFEPAARDLMWPQWNAWREESAGCPRERQWFLDKLRGYSVRLAGVLHILKLAPQGAGLRPIDADSARRALLLSKWFLAQFDALQPAIDGETEGLPAPIAKLMQKTSGAKWKGKPVTINQATKWGVPHRQPSADEVLQLFQSAVALGQGRIEPTARSFQWVPNPSH
jgi:hypothetical protein